MDLTLNWGILLAPLASCPHCGRGASEHAGPCWSATGGGRFRDGVLAR